MSEKLKPCPFCGGKARPDDPGEVDDWGIVCGKCGVFAIFGKDGETMAKKDAINAWNRRSGDGDTGKHKNA